MCGITGYINPAGINIPEIKRMNDSLIHRGPDDSGVYVNGKVGLGQRRLSIIDLAGGHQPMCNEDGTIWITFNGEIYNFQEIRNSLTKDHIFKTKSDTEVILHLYEEKGEELLKDLRGMFAFAIWDSEKDKLFIARDHFGQKPLYYWHNGSEFAFASEIKALLALNPELKKMDPNALYEYLTLRIITPPRSMFKDVKKLPPSHYLIFEDGKIQVKRYWQLNYISKSKASFKNVLNELDQRVQETVKYHLVSDVPVGAFLSGGVDSSLVTAMMTKFASGPVKTFAGDVPYKNFSEIAYANLVSEQYKTENHILHFKPSLIKTLPEMVWHLDEPSDSLTVAMYYISQLARKHVKVVLGGDGGDELFGGYHRYYGNIYASYYAMIPQSIRKNVFSKVLDVLPDGSWYQSLSHKLKWIHNISFYDNGERYSRSLSYFYFSNGYHNSLLTEKFKKDVMAFDPEASVKEYFDSSNANELIDKMLYSDSMIRMPDHPVMVLDRMTMAHGLESRSPFLDHKLAEFCATIPPEFKVKGTKRRFIQIELAKKYLPQEVIFRRKQGFASPINYLLDNEFRLLFKKYLTNSHLVENGYFNKKIIDNLLREHLEKKADHSQRLWLLFNAEIWHRMFIDGITKEEFHDELTEMK